MPTEKLGLAKREANRASPLKRVANSWLPALQASSKNLRSFKRLRESASTKNDKPFNYHDLLAEVGHNESDTRHWPRLPDISGSNLKNPDSSAEIPNGRRCNDCIQLAEAQRETAASLQVARNVIESLERSVRLIQTRLALYERDMRVLRQGLSRSNEEGLSLSAQEQKTKNHFAAPPGNPIDLPAKANSSEDAPVPAVEGTEPIVATDATEFGQADNQMRNEIDQSLVKCQAEIKMLATVLVAQNEQIERLNTANMMLATRSDVLTKNTQALEKAQRRTEEAAQFQTKAVKFLVSELRAERSAAEYDAANLLCALRHERSEHSAAERDAAAMRNALVLLLPKLAVRSKTTE